MTQRLIISGAVLAEGVFWVWLFANAIRGHYPVTFIGWASLGLDPIIAIVLVTAFLADRKYRSRDQ